MKVIINNIFPSIHCRSISAMMHWDLPFFVGMTNSRNMFLWLWEHALDLQLSIYQILFLVFEGMMLEKRCMFKK